MKITSVNPSNGQLLKAFKPSSREEIDAIILKARNTFENVWAGIGLQERIELFNKLSKVISDATQEILDLLLLEVGKPNSLGSFEVEDITSGIAYYCSEIQKLGVQLFPIDPNSIPETSVELPLVPQGVIGIISPWNFPFWTPMTNIVPAILTGNTVVFKPDEHATMMGQKIIELFQRAGFPDGVMNLIIGDATAGKNLVVSDVDKIVVTGSVETGAAVIKNAGIKPVLVELGGNDAAIVCADADLDKAVPAICWGAVYNAGQACNGIKRVYVHTSVSDEFLKRAMSYIRQLERGRDYGPIIDAEARGIIVERIKAAAHRGAQLFPNKIQNEGRGFWLDPIIITYDKDNLELIQNETFGPVIPIRVVQDEDEAIKLANDSPFGLGANVWTKNIEKGKVLAMRLQAKMVCVNEALFGLPGGEYWGGWKASGLGTTESRLLAFLKKKILVAYSGVKPRSWWFPPNSSGIQQ